MKFDRRTFFPRPPRSLIRMFALALFSVFLVGCLGGEADLSGYTEHRDTVNNFAISVPSTFLQLPAKDLPADTLAAFADIVNIVPGFTPNVSVVKKPLAAPLSSLALARANVARAPEVLANYKSIEVREITLGGVPTLLHVFSAGEKESEIKYFQIYFSAPTQDGFVVTAAMPPAASSAAAGAYEKSVLSFKIL